MTIVELRDRLTQIIESNEKHGWAERNESVVVVHHKVSKLVHEYLPVKRTVNNALTSPWRHVYPWVGLGPNTNVFEINLEPTPIWRNGRNSIYPS